ncbi:MULTISPECIES: hypothetical protein [unclassified Streptomyces]|uniref:hypothetical protein n=1 Tax=unclassified Streptomyces TaxID=2593676 RepID=UPI002286CC2B|nr:hypothetical protein [Streptomyces sp. Je 1-369]WAL96731.1 hypothetical protein NOO62_20930 [Streptomyces sp. Je 1-369]
MAHTAPVHYAPRARAASSSASRWAGLALLAGVVYGLWACAIRRDGGPITTGNVMFGVVTGLILAAVMFALHRLAPSLPRELRALSWTAFAGIAFGFLYSLGGASVLRSTVMALVVAAGVFAVLFYRYYTTE